MWSVGWDSVVSIATGYGTEWSGDRIPEWVDFPNASGPVVHALDGYSGRDVTLIIRPIYHRG